MNGVHDMGGMHGMGPIAPEPNEPVFHERWEARVFALNRALGTFGKWNIDAGRHSRERIPPADSRAEPHLASNSTAFTSTVRSIPSAPRSGPVNRRAKESAQPVSSVAEAPVAR